ncbi:MAG: hypothetical protein JWP63_3768 [Candidatus Solibacter sp.]|jgi:uncharacterized protein (TIGR03435 family)|nr:hypothetical protein [Candidatus Solibacter sp.]
MRTVYVLLFASLAACTFGQQAAEVLEFEAVSIKVNSSGSGSSRSHDTSGQWVAENLSLRDYVRRAFEIRDYQVQGPDWMSSARFDIVAKFPPHTGDSQLGPRLQKLLTDRFKLAVHRETKEFPVYALVKGKNSPKLKAAADTGPQGTNSTRGRLTGQRITMARLAEFLAQRMDRPVVDLTGLTGMYDLTLEWTTDEAAAGDAPPGPTLEAALQQQLGLRLQSQRAPIMLIVVDHIEKLPVDN